MALMTCPRCGTSVDETALRCPACHADLASTMRIPRQLGSWCASCGALIPRGSVTCPACGLPSSTAWAIGGDDAHRSVGAPDDAQADLGEDPSASGDEAIVGIEPALPAEPGRSTDVSGVGETLRAPQVLAFVVMAVLAVVLVGVVITRPWDPDAYSISTTTGTDTSRAGFPGEREVLTSQDRSVISRERGGDASAPAFPTLWDAWAELGRLRGRLEASDLLLRSVAEGSVDLAEAQAGAQEARDVSLDLQAVTDALMGDEIEPDGDARERERITTLDAWLRTWSDAVNQAWERAESVGYGASPQASVPLDALADDGGANAFRTLFDESYDAWEPARPSAE